MKTGSLTSELRSNGASATQNCLGNTTISWAKVCSSSRSRVLFKLTADQAWVFDRMTGSCQANLLKTEPGCSEAC